MSTTHRPLRTIAADIAADWRKPYFGAVPYLDAMHGLDAVTDEYGCETARSVVVYFLSNAATWRGATAKAVKAELNAILRGVR